MSPNTEEMVWRHSRENLEGAFENLMALFPFDDPYIGTSEQESRALSLRAALASRYAGEIKLDTAEDSSDFPGLVASAYRIEVFMLKQLVWYYVYNDPALASRSFVREN